MWKCSVYRHFDSLVLWENLYRMVHNVCRKQRRTHTALHPPRYWGQHRSCSVLQSLEPLVVALSLAHSPSLQRTFGNTCVCTGWIERPCSLQAVHNDSEPPFGTSCKTAKCFHDVSGCEVDSNRVHKRCARWRLQLRLSARCGYVRQRNAPRSLNRSS